MSTVGQLKQVVGMDDIEMFSYIVSAACHDLDHPGQGNPFLIETKDSIALRYNDISVLENYHVAGTFDILNQEKYDILANFDKLTFKRIRKLMIGAILATDMANHFSKFSIFKGKIMSDDANDYKNDDEKLFICQEIFHLCDISNASKPWNICEKWTNLLFIEFFDQGDKERKLGIPISQFMDRETTNIAKSQIGFINFIIKPSFDVVHLLLPQISRTIEGINENKKLWELNRDKYEEKMKKF